jgi:hypothetical protein
MDRYVQTARLRDTSIKAERRRRIEARRNRHMKKHMPRSAAHADENDVCAKLRSVISAIRAHTNTDIDINSNMSPSQLFTATLKALSEPSADRSATETKFVGEAMDLVSKLNVVLSSR